MSEPKKGNSENLCTVAGLIGMAIGVIFWPLFFVGLLLMAFAIIQLGIRKPVAGVLMAIIVLLFAIVIIWPPS